MRAPNTAAHDGTLAGSGRTAPGRAPRRGRRYAPRMTSGLTSERHPPVSPEKWHGHERKGVR